MLRIAFCWSPVYSHAGSGRCRSCPQLTEFRLGYNKYEKRRRHRCSDKRKPAQRLAKRRIQHSFGIHRHRPGTAYQTERACHCLVPGSFCAERRANFQRQYPGQLHPSRRRHFNGFRRGNRNRPGSRSYANLSPLRQHQQPELRQRPGGKHCFANDVADKQRNWQRHHFAGCHHGHRFFVQRLFRNGHRCRGSDHAHHCEFCANFRRKRRGQPQHRQ